jgi:hypothetical protein
MCFVTRLKNEGRDDVEDCERSSNFKGALDGACRLFRELVPRCFAGSDGASSTVFVIDSEPVGNIDARGADRGGMFGLISSDEMTP